MSFFRTAHRIFFGQGTLLLEFPEVLDSWSDWNGRKATLTLCFKYSLGKAIDNLCLFDFINAVFLEEIDVFVVFLRVAGVEHF